MQVKSALIQLLDGRREGQFRRPQAPFEAVVVAVGALYVDEQAETVLEGQIGVLGIAKLLFERGAESGQPEPRQFVEQWSC